MSENQPLEESLKEKDKQINRLQMQIKLSSNLSKELERQKSLALEAQEEIKKSIQYASRIQTAMLPTDLPKACLLYTSPSPRDRTRSRMPSSA